MTTDTRRCHAPGDKCLGCDHYYGKADKCKYEEAMTTEDLKSMTVEAHKHAFIFHPVGKITDQPNAVRKCSCGLDLLDAYNELARRLEEAQQKIVAQQEMVRGLRHALGAMITEAKARNCGLRIADEVYSHAIVYDLAALAAHDAELTAKAKAEALEEAASEILAEAENFLFNKEDRQSAAALNAVFVRLDEKAAEYRAKAGRKE